MRWLITGDNHLRPDTWARLPQLRGDAFESLRQIAELARAADVAGVVLLGDVLDSVHPDALTVRTLSQCVDYVRRVAKAVYVIQGNHDLVLTRDAESFPAAWAEAVAGEWVHGKVLNLGGGHHGYALDYTPANKIAEAFAAIPPQCDVLFCHQAWAEIQRVGHIDANAEMLPPNIRHVFSGDYHKTVEYVGRNKEGNPVMFYSPGSTCMQAMNEDPQKFVYLVDFDHPTLGVNHVALKTRPFTKLVFKTVAEFEAFLANPQIGTSGAAGYGDVAIAVPLVHAKVSDSVPNYRERLRQCLGPDVHLDTEPLPREDTTVVIDYEAHAVQGGFETLASAVRVLAGRDNLPSEITEDCIRLLSAADRPAMLAKIRSEFLERVKP